MSRIISRLILALPFLAVLILAGNVITATVAQAQSPYARLFNYNGKCLDMTGGSTSNGTRPQLWTCNSNNWQYWESVPVSNPLGGAAYLLKNYHSGKCLSILDNKTAPGSGVIQYNCNNSGSDLFEDWAPSCPGSYDGYCTWEDVGMETSTNCCYMHPSGDGSSNGLEIYASNQPDHLAYRWKWGAHLS